MLNYYSSTEEFKCDCFAWGFNPEQQFTDDVYRIFQDGSVRRKLISSGAVFAEGYYFSNGRD